MRQHHVIIDRDKCVGCSRCASVCVAHNIVIKNKKAETVLDDCLMCGQCSAVCPKKAITVSGYHTDQKEKQGGYPSGSPGSAGGNPIPQKHPSF